ATSSALVDDARGESLSCARMLAAVAKAVAMQWPECARLRVDWLHRARMHGDVGPWSALLPVALDMASAGDTGKAVEAFERQLRNAEAVLRYLGLHDNRRSAPLLFDWLPSADMPVSNELLQPLDGDTGPLAAGTNRLAHPLTLTARIRDEQLAVSLRHDPDTIPSHTADAFARKLRDALVAVAAGQQAPRSRHSPEDFPLAALSCEELERFPIDLDRVQDIMTLSPIQRLHHALSGTDHDAGFDQWVFRLEGDIDEAAFDAAWQQLLDRHDALRAVFVDRGLAEPHQAVLRDVAAPVRHEDWRDVDEATRKRRLQAFLADDRRQGVCADAAPLMRLTLIREGAREWTLAWRHHQAFVDGWSWPVLAAELGELHDAIAEQRDAGLPPAGTFRAYLAALKARDIDAHAAFWREHLENAGHARTLIARGGRDGNGERSRRDMRRFEMPVRANLGERLDRLARRLRITPSLVFQSAWALLLAGLAQRFTVTMGVAFSGRTALPMPDRTVGAFVNDLPVHLKLPPTERIDHWLASLRTLQADLNHYQNASPQEIHRWAGIRPGERLFDTLLVMQNQVVGSAARHWGKRIRVRGIDAGMQTNYPLGIAVTPGRNLRIDFFHDASVMDADSVRAIADELHRILAAMADNPDIRVSTVINHLRGRPEAFAISEPRAVQQPGTDDGEGRSAPAAGDALEHTITAICESVLGATGFDAKRNFFDAGAQSLALIEIHERLQKSLDRQFPIVMLFRHPSVSVLAAYLRGEDESAADGIERGAQQRAALMRRRMMRQPGNLER
ncbi:MAG TPA: condensation domain-containing protein, partial [Gammaproteobacteria bacterium]